jgi:hypothetical protein
MFESVVLGAGKKLATDKLVALLEQQLGIQQESIQILRSLDRDVSSILHGPFQTAMAYVGDASATHRTPAERSSALDRARHELMRALGQETDPLIRAEVELHLALVWVGCGSASDALVYADRADTDLVGGIEDRISCRNSQLRRSWQLRGASGMDDAAHTAFLRMTDEFNHYMLQQHHVLVLKSKLGTKPPNLVQAIVDADGGRELPSAAAQIAGRFIWRTRETFKGAQVTGARGFTTQPIFTLSNAVLSAPPTDAAPRIEWRTATHGY